MKKWLCLAFLWGSANVWASQEFDQCLAETIKLERFSSTVEVREYCENTVNNVPRKYGVISKRIKEERESQWNRFVITPHRRNYILPITHTSRLNREAYEFADEWEDELKHTEAKFQLSLKVPLNHKDLFHKSDGLYLGFTMQAWWQVYASGISAPFRETNYQPELFYLAPLSWKPLGGNTGIALGIEHQSNGRSQALSRSWNRVYANFLFERENLAVSFRPWYRLREDDKDEPGDPDGDDNPDIEQYMGHFELSAAYRWKDYQFGVMGRNNLRSDNNGAIEFDWSFPMFGHLRGFVQYFKGYGESMIDYDISQERIGVGILLTDIL